MKKVALVLLLLIHGVGIMHFVFLLGCAQLAETTTTTTTTTSTSSTTTTTSTTASSTTTTASSTTTTTGGSYIVRLYYTYPTDATKKSKTYDSQNFGSTYSSDGINFTKDSGARLGPVANLSDPDFFKESTNKWVLFYSKAVSEDSSEKYRLYKATSSSPNGSFGDDTNFAGYELGNLSSTIKIGSTFYVYLVNNGIKIATYDPTQNKLTLVGSADSQGVDPSVIQISTNSFKLYYKKSGDTYSADSSDGLIWGTGTKIVSYAEVPGVIYVGGKIYLYYTNSAPSDPNMGQTMVKISSDNGVAFGSAQVVTGLGDAACDPDPVAYE